MLRVVFWTLKVSELLCKYTHVVHKYVYFNIFLMDAIAMSSDKAKLSLKIGKILFKTGCFRVVFL